jgi:Domain of unknown function (DUF4258)
MYGHMALDITVTRRTAARAGCITWRYHALVRAQEGGITRAQAIRVLTEGKSSSNAREPNLFPNVCSCACRKTTKPLYVSVGYDASNDRLYVITVHWLDPRKWEDP